MKIAKLLTAIVLSARLGFAAQAQGETPELVGFKPQLRPD
jgi:hypothetical protein